MFLMKGKVSFMLLDLVSAQKMETLWHSPFIHQDFVLLLTLL